MKKIIILIIVVMLSFSCSVNYSNSYSEEEYYNSRVDEIFASRINKDTIYYLDAFYSLRTIEEILQYITTNVRYVSDGETDTWSTAEETLTRGYGDCEDYVILFMNIYYVVFGEKATMVLIFEDFRIIVDGGEVDHAIIKLENGLFIDPQKLEKINQEVPVKYMYPFDLFFI